MEIYQSFCLFLFESILFIFSNDIPILSLMYQHYLWSQTVYFDAYLKENRSIRFNWKHIVKKNSPSEVQKCKWASIVFVFRLFLISQTRNVLSSEQLRRYFPPGWNKRPRTQLSWPVWNEECSYWWFFFHRKTFLIDSLEWINKGHW